MQDRRPIAPVQCDERMVGAQGLSKIRHGAVDIGQGRLKRRLPMPAYPAHKPRLGQHVQVGIRQGRLEIHSGRNRIVRRIFEHLGYDVRGLDRVMYAGLTKKNVQRGHWRLLTEKEIRVLKYLNSSIKGSSDRAPKHPAPKSSRLE